MLEARCRLKSACWDGVLSMTVCRWWNLAALAEDQRIIKTTLCKQHGMFSVCSLGAKVQPSQAGWSSTCDIIIGKQWSKCRHSTFISQKTNKRRELRNRVAHALHNLIHPPSVDQGAARWVTGKIQPRSHVSLAGGNIVHPGVPASIYNLLIQKQTTSVEFLTTVMRLNLWGSHQGKKPRIQISLASPLPNHDGGFSAGWTTQALKHTFTFRERTIVTFYHKDNTCLDVKGQEKVHHRIHIPWYNGIPMLMSKKFG